jgi:hypothetical protein
VSTRRTLPFALAAAVGLALAACPLPQPVPDVARTADGGAVTIPVILPETAIPPETIVLVLPNCEGAGAQFTLGATIEDFDTTEIIEARWFVDYRDDNTGVQFQEPQVQPSPDPNVPLRALTPFIFAPYTFGRSTGTPLHVAEVVVSNGFVANDPTLPRNRSVPPPFETQVYRWVFQYVDASDARGRCE